MFEGNEEKLRLNSGNCALKILPLTVFPVFHALLKQMYNGSWGNLDVYVLPAG